ncbi:MAG: LacI family DNA-binding transcriptional regulator [Devosia sp.]
MATITDVSRLAGVSRSTVSRVIAGNGYVSDERRRAIEKAIADLGYRPNTLAQALRSNRSNMIGAVVVDVASPFYAQMVGGIQETGRTAGRSVLIASGYADRDEEARAILELLDRSCDGLILYLENAMRPDVVDIVARANALVVTVGGDECPVAKARVAIDNYSGALAGMRHLLALGHRRIAYLSGGLMYRDTRERLRGIEAALGERRLGLGDIIVEHGSFSEKFGYAATQKLLGDHPEVTAIFGGDDDVSAGALLAIKEAGLVVPDDISLLGFDDNFHARHLTPGLTTVRQPVDEAGRAAARLLLALLDGERPHELTVTIPTELVLRGSVGPVRNSTLGCKARLATTGA